MHSRFFSLYVLAAISFLPILSKTNANAADWFDGQEILVKCPVWEWEPSPIPNVEYQLCFDDFDHCTAARIGDSVCIPSLGTHDVWVTAVDNQSGEPVYYDGDIVPIDRVKNADFTGDDVVGITDMGLFIKFFGKRKKSPTDLDGDRIVGMLDFSLFTRAFGKCVNASETLFEPC